MPNTVIQLKKSATTSSVPSDLANGELAINFADGKLFYKNTAGFIAEISSPPVNSFGTVNANGTLVVSDTSGDVLTIVPGNNITVVGDAVNDKITLGLKDDVTVPGLLFVSASSGDEGGELRLANAITNSLLAGPVNIDIYQNKLRFFVSGGDARGAFINLAATSAGVGTDLLAGGSSTDTVARTAAGAAFDKANAALPNTNGVTFAGTLTISANLNADKVISSNNGQAENFKIGDDAWIGDYNVANSIKLKGQQNTSIGYISFGMDDGTALGRAGTGNLTYGGNTIWHAGIDGAGSGLDADLLDGQQGSYYAVATDLTAAFNRANTANSVAIANVNYVNTAMQAAFSTSNVAIANVNYVNTAMQAAFAKANTGGGAVAVSDVAPSSPTANSLWWSSDLGKMFIYYNDGSSFQWVETSPSPDTATISLTYAIAQASYDKANAVSISIVPTSVSSEQYILFTGNTSGNLSQSNINFGLSFNASSNTLNVSGTVRDSKGDVRDLPLNNQILGYGLTLSDSGKVVSTNAAVYVPNAVFFSGNSVSVYNNSASSLTITSNSGVTMYLAGTATTGNRTLAQRGVATMLCIYANTFVISGAGLT